MGMVRDESKQKSSTNSECCVRSREVRGNKGEKEGEHDLRHLPPGVLNHYLTHANLSSSQPNTQKHAHRHTEKF